MHISLISKVIFSDNFRFGKTQGEVAIVASVCSHEQLKRLYTYLHNSLKRPRNARGNIRGRTGYHM